MKYLEWQISQYFEFGPFRLTPGEHRLYRDGEIVLLPPKEFDLLLLLVQNSGQVMNRENLIKALWPNTVVEEANLNVHISALRKVLAENQGEQRYIETLPRLGYRFIAPVTEVDESEPASQTRPFTPHLPAPIASGSIIKVENGGGAIHSDMTLATHHQLTNIDWYSRHRFALFSLPIWMMAFALLGILIIFYFSPSRLFRGESAEYSSMNVVPLTTYPGRESQPAFSPDGNQIAFVWDGEKGGNEDIYVRLVDGGNAVRLTNHPGNDVNPVWSPDGRTIAFYRSATDGDAIFLTPALGGAERKLTGVWANRFGFGSHTWIHWSPDGKWLVLSDKNSPDEPFSLTLLSPENGEMRRLTGPPKFVIGDCSPAFSPDGNQLAFVRVFSAVVGEIFLVSLTGGEPRRLTFDGAGASNLAWTPDGREIVFSSRHNGKSRLMKVPMSGGTPQWLAASGSDVQYPAFSRQGNRLAWRQNTDNTDIFRVDLKGAEQLPDSLPGLIASTANEVSPRYSPDGKKIAFVSTRSGSDEIWVCDSDGENPSRLTSFRGPLAGSPSWSPDSRQIVFDCRPDGNADIFVVSCEGGQPRRLTYDPAEDVVPSWSHDGRWIYFTSSRSGRLQIWKMPSGGGDAIQVTKQGGFEPLESPDGQWIYFTQDRGSSSIRRIAAAGGDETLVFDFHQKSLSRMWTVGSDGVFFVETETPARSTIKFFHLSNHSLKTLADLDGNPPGGVSGMTVSPDGRWLLYPQTRMRGSDLMMIENFR